MSVKKNRFIQLFLLFFACFIVSFFFAQDILKILSNPMKAAFFALVQNSSVVTPSFSIISLSPYALFSFYVKVALFSASLVLLPLFATWLYFRFASDVHKNKRSRLFLFGIVTSILSISGILFAYYVTIPIEFKYHFSVLPHEPRLFTMKIAPYMPKFIELIMEHILFFSILFQLPLLPWVLIKRDNVSRAKH